MSKKIDTPIWTKTEDLTPVSNAYTHWIKHRKEFSEKNYNNSKEYVNDTHDFVNNPSAGVLIKKRGNGDTLYYHPESNTFSVMNKHGVPKTMFKPKNKMLYWEKQ
ncbi:hypothetical protein ACIPT4_08120 [Pectobacterium jejuense]|uniref:hypothetical protein n=1 Tax=Pectobacterium jejuense TaxID=2974022 RepID=UPI00381A4BC2